MRTLSLLSLPLLSTLLWTGRVASAQEAAPSRSGVGIGAEVMNTGLTGGAFVYDTGRFHITGLLGVVDVEDAATDLAIGGRFYFVVHSSQAADLSVGGGIALEFESFDGPRDDELDFHLEGGAKIRAFIVPNVALSLSVGLGMLLEDDEEDGDDDDNAIITIGPPLPGSQLIGTAGLTYFFY